MTDNAQRFNSNIIIINEDMIGEEIVYYDRVLLFDGRQLLTAIPDVIISMTHPLNGRTIVGPSSILAKTFVRFDVAEGHRAAAEHIQAQMARAEAAEEE